MKSSDKQHTQLSNLSLMIFFETLSPLLSAGLTARDSIEIMADDSDLEVEKKSLACLLVALETRYELHNAMKHTALFPAYAVNTVMLAERSGNLANACDSLADYYEKESRITAQLKQAITTPVVLICVITAVVAFLVFAILPIFDQIYAQMGINMNSNGIVQVAILVSSIVLWIMFGLLVIAIVGLLFSRTNPGKRFFSNLFERSPFTRKFHASLSMARFTSMFSMLLASGDEVSMAMNLAGSVCSNTEIRGKIDRCYKRIIAGDSFAIVLVDSGLVSKTHSGMLKSGVRSGSIPKVMRRLSEIYEQQTDKTLARFLSMIEPVLIGVLAVVIGTMLLCVMLPFIGMMTSLG